MGPVPPVYHYTSAEAARPIIESRVFRATGLRFLNDTRELNHGIALTRNIVAAAISEEPQYAEYREAMLRVTRPNPTPLSRSPIYVTSFSENGDLLSQWQAYCPGGGYALAFDRAALRRLGRLAGARLRRCLYTPDEQTARLRERLSWCGALNIGSCPPERPLRLPDYHDGLLGFQQTLPSVWPELKDSAFRAEAEWRLIGERHPGPHEEIFGPLGPTKYYGRTATLVPYVELELFSDEEPFPIGGATVAPTAFGDIARDSLAEFLHQRGYSAVADNVRVSAIPYRPLPR